VESAADLRREGGAGASLESPSLVERLPRPWRPRLPFSSLTSKEALRILELNAQENPSSYTYDSLGEACTEAGDKECAIKSFKKSLLLSPDDMNAAEKLKKLDGPSD